MKELNQAVYYTTAQVTELVDLSDQNVRKYVRLLEDRKYEVAKDEHNRRLFSANDVLILRELITKAKKPGHTLESAADEIVNEIGEIISASGHGVSTTSSDNDIKEMFSHVIERLDAIQDENKDLKDNIRNLVERLEQYDQNNSQRYIETTSEEEYIADDNVTEDAEPTDTTDTNADIEGEDRSVENNVEEMDKEEIDNDVYKDTNQTSESDETEKEQSVDEAPSVSENPEKNNIDMRDFNQEEESESKEAQGDDIQQENTQVYKQNDEEKEGFFSSLFKMFKK
ncbi:hypothetical protein [Salinicoccus sp. YB14-2]|uniref:hypothetical protein n=1 Tax=Salinicoccus sp. YB14-2 TaxID=1572701 RepID=UPI00068FA10A|nr:hypothetical protein [Salinicoccus sp. YB14-2]